MRSSHIVENCSTVCRRWDARVRETNTNTPIDDASVVLTQTVVFSHAAPQPPTHLSVKQGPTNDTIELLWSGPSFGDYDSFHLRWTPPDRLSVTQTRLTSRIVAGMFPGRRYNFTVVTVSGGGARGGPMVMSQPIQRIVRTSR